MLPLLRDYRPIPCGWNIFPMSAPVLFFRGGPPWLLHPSQTPTFQGLLPENPVSCDRPSQTMQTRKASFERLCPSEKSKQKQKSDSELIRNRFDSEQLIQLEGLKSGENHEEEGESSYNLRRKKPSRKTKKIKKGPQNNNRNILPSIIQQILSFLTKPNKSKYLCEKVFQRLADLPDTQFTVSKYYYFIKSVKDKQNHYVNEKTLQVLNQIQEIGINLFPISEQRFYLKVARILARHFLLEVCPFTIVKSRRILIEKRIEHLRVRRDILALISQLEC